MTMEPPYSHLNHVLCLRVPGVLGFLVRMAVSEEWRGVKEVDSTGILPEVFDQLEISHHHIITWLKYGGKSKCFKRLLEHSKKLELDMVMSAARGAQRSQETHRARADKHERTGITCWTCPHNQL